ncbi:LON peptidase substrate-binding domain-containing protein [Dactylosporangium vinaceum]|uniref:LON peptidase substrate-binding domain-containing protein n=1 Tax=Dactylosporangium vinaceum TaxID=53362 RepID=A0ABV5MGS6_9ACTN|nr:LON peptidase substrate-binding domain-containing protein [Dactylosporangium vinaceum]
MELLPLFPLGTVLFPGLVLPLHVFEPRYRTLIQHLTELPANLPREFGVIAIRRGWEVGRQSEAADATITAGESLSLYEIGCAAEIRQITELPDGRFDLMTLGRRRFRLVGVARNDAPYLTGEVEWLPEPKGDPDREGELAAGVLSAYQDYLRAVRADEDGEQLPDDPTVLSHLVAATASLTLEDRQSLLAEPDTQSRLKSERALLRRETALLGQIRAVPVSLGDLAVPSSPN